MKTTRKHYSAEFKAKVALDAIRGDLTLAELAAKHSVHHTMIAAWRRQAIDGMASTSAGAGDAAKAASESEVEKLHAKIGQLVVQRVFLAKAFGRSAWAGGGRWSNLLTTVYRSRRSVACCGSAARPIAMLRFRKRTRR